LSEAKFTLGLKLPTDPRWVNMAEMSLDHILTDHAYCEQKAATSCISLIQKYPDRIKLVNELAPIVTEEWGHFRQVLNELNRRNLKLGSQRKDIYVNKLIDFQKQHATNQNILLYRLLVFALIEARSCERFRLLSLNMKDEYFKEFYYKFMVSEAGHYRLFLDLAKTYFDESEVMETWQNLLDYEKEMLKTLEVRGDRMH